MALLLTVVCHAQEAGDVYARFESEIVPTKNSTVNFRGAITGNVYDPLIIKYTGSYTEEDGNSFMLTYGTNTNVEVFRLLHYCFHGDMVVIINDYAYPTYKACYGEAYIYGPTESYDVSMPSHYNASFVNGSSNMIMVSKKFGREAWGFIQENNLTDSLKYSFTVAIIGRVQTYELKPINDKYATVDDFLKATDFSGLSATEVAAKLTGSFYCTATDTRGATWTLLCPVTCWSVNLKKKTVTFKPKLVIKEFESEMTSSDVINAPDLYLLNNSDFHNPPTSLTIPLDTYDPSAALTDVTVPSPTVRTEPGAITVSGAEADVFALDGRLVGRTSGGRLNVAKGFYIVRPDGGESVSVIVK